MGSNKRVYVVEISDSFRKFIFIYVIKRTKRMNYFFIGNKKRTNERLTWQQRTNVNINSSSYLESF